ncbi:nicotinate-nucleotide adenylyltransferase [Anaerotalea alkaliphila]|uniref:Probable nicotinate-nucleotide adenylyltransferase n=1 Tax=Anaerotalea alkaliphila TaxID=2662126 RepID=A0A7X5KNL7_9FIRM|nr:nicotinate-nucleotide adenylyltransferase [Anaerotalea alkaliphila]NDL67923.1 nicotinate-nucleotide adenylyltransferase [Anaerotalea alkaliphila]
MGKRIAWMGGSFNPVHTGHLVAASEVADSRYFDRVCFLPSGTPAHKPDIQMASAKHRLGMLEAALQEDDRFLISTEELYRSGNTYTFDTMTALGKRFPEDRHFLVVGSDAFLDLQKWHRSEELLQICNFALVNRSGYSREAIDRQKAWILDRFPCQIQEIEIPDMEISSSDIRRRVRERRTIRYLVPESVAAYINRYDLYR